MKTLSAMFLLAACLILAFIPSTYGGTGPKGGAGWTYSGPLGPEQWHTQYPDCGRRMQSPINVDTLDALYDPNLQGFDMHQYACRNCTMELENKGGHTAEVTFGGEQIVIKGGSLPDEYVLKQFHFHWGKENNEGSEHMINNVYAPMEMHIVHFMKGITNKVEEHPYGLAVLGFFFKVGEHNEKFEKLLEHFDKITYRDSKVEIEPFGLLDLLPVEATIFYRYYGSLTTPPCYETVIWTLFDKRIEISQDQLNTFRSLKSVEEGEGEESAISRNDRPVQELHERRVTTNNVRSSLLYSAIIEQRRNMTTSLDDLADAVQELKDQHVNMSEVTNLNKEMKDMHAGLANTLKELEYNLTALGSLQSDVNDLKSAIGDIKVEAQELKDLHSSMPEIAGLSKEMKALQVDLQEDLTSLHSLQSNLTLLRSLKADVNTLTAKLDSNHADARAVTSLALVTSMAVFVTALWQTM